MLLMKVNVILRKDEVHGERVGGVDDKIMMSTMTCSHVDSNTCANLWSDSFIRWISRRRMIKVKKLILDALEGRELEELIDEYFEDTFTIFMSEMSTPVKSKASLRETCRRM